MAVLRGAGGGWAVAWASAPLLPTNRHIRSAATLVVRVHGMPADNTAGRLRRWRGVGHEARLALNSKRRSQAGCSAINART